MKGKLIKLISIIAIISMMVMPASAKPAQVIPDDNATISSDIQYTGNYIIVFTDLGMVEYRGAMKGLSATAPAEGMKLDSKSTAALAYKAFLESNQNTYLASMEKSLGRELKVLGRLHYGVSAVVVPMSDAEAKQIERMAQIKAVYKETIEQVDTDAVQGGSVLLASGMAQMYLVELERWVKGWSLVSSTRGSIPTIPPLRISVEMATITPIPGGRVCTGASAILTTRLIIPFLSAMTN